MKNIIFTLILALAVVIGIGASVRDCKQLPDTSSAKIDTVIQTRHDTLVKLDTILQDKIKYIKSAPDTLIIKEFERVYVSDPDDTTKVQTTVSAERKALIVKDSLTWCMSCRTVDSGVIDSLSKIGKEKPSQSLDYKGYGLAVGAGLLLGIILTR